MRLKFFSNAILPTASQLAWLEPDVREWISSFVVGDPQKTSRSVEALKAAGFAGLYYHTDDNEEETDGPEPE